MQLSDFADFFPCHYCWSGSESCDGRGFELGILITLLGVVTGSSSFLGNGSLGDVHEVSCCSLIIRPLMMTFVEIGQKVSPAR